MRRAALCWLLLTGCDTSAQAVCDLECECEHCSDLEHDLRCAGHAWRQDVAATYGCEDKFDSWAECVEANGKCNDRTASFTTHATGSCNAGQPTNYGCISSADCTAVFGAGASCDGNVCLTKLCANVGNACQSDVDCVQGVDLCSEEADALYACQNEASAVNPFIPPSTSSEQPID